MDKQTLRYTYLTYFAGQYAKKEDMDYEALVEMAGDNYELCTEVISELVKEGLVEGIKLIETKAGYAVGQYQGKLKLTTKGIKELLNLFPEEKKEIIIDIKSDIENQKHKVVSLEDIINKENERISKLSKKEKVKEIKEKILLLFWDYNINAHNYNEGKILHSEIKSKIRKIVQHYYDGAISTLSKEAINELRLEDYIKYRYEDKNSEIQINTLLTPKGIAHIKNEKAKKESELKDYIEKNNIKIPNEVFKIQNILTDIYAKTNTEQLQAAAEVMQNSGIQAVMKALENAPINHIMQNINKYYSPLYNESFLSNYDKLVNSINNSAKAISNNLNPDKKSLTDLIKEPSSNLYKELTKESKDNTDPCIFEGILGQNCGEVEKYINSSKQLQAKDFVVSRGIRVLRGYAKASDIYKASKTEYDYQRPINEPHIDSIKDFLLKMKDSAKYLPEVTLVARNDYELEKFTLNLKSLSDTQKGIIDNLNYYKLKVQQNSLYRIDGNHRIEAANSIYIEYSKDLYLPFSIILWNPEDYYGDGSKVWKDMIDEERKENEAFLFYFLNSKAKKLEIEENLQGIIKASRIRWSDDDLKIANPNLSLMRLYQEQMQTQIYLNDELCKKDSLKQIAEILTQINENNSKSQIDLDKFKIILQRTNFILNTYKPIKLKEFSFYCKLVFYIVYKNEQDEECIKILENLDNWVIKYKFDNSTFTDPILLYNNATKSNYLKPINIFVAMPFDEENVENYTEWINLSITKLKEKNIKHSEQLNLNKIMPNRGYAINLIDKIMDEIQECDIFIADISPCIITIDGQEIKCDANPNVMYELGIAHNLKKPIILMREDNKFSKVPSDIQEKYRNTYKRSNTKKTQQTIQKAIECVLEDFFD